MNKLCLGCFEYFDEQLPECPYCHEARGLPLNDAILLAAGTRLRGRFIIGRVLGSGEFGVTYLAYDTELGEKRAIKEYFPGEFCARVPGLSRVTIYSGISREQYLAGKEKLLEESRRLAQFREEPEIVHIYDCFEENDTAYIVMEYLEGETLKERLERENKLQPDEALSILQPVLAGLEKVHRVGMLHRDVAPENIFLLKDGGVKLFDFGAARFATTNRTRSLTVQIKTGFTPVEQYQSRGNQGPWTDVYSAAAVFYRAVSGENPPDAMKRLVKDTIKPISQLGLNIDSNLNNAIMNALNVTPEARTSSAEDFAAELKQTAVVRRKEKKKKKDLGNMSVLTRGAICIGILAAVGTMYFAVRTNVERLLPDTEYRREVMMPDLTGLALEESEQLLKDIGLKLHVGAKEYSQEILRNRVMDQSIEATSRIKTGETVEVTLSAGVEQTYVPYFIGESGDTLGDTVLEYGLTPDFTETESWYEPGAAVSQTIDPYTVTDSGSVVGIQISTGYMDTGKTGSVTVDKYVSLDIEQAGQKASTKDLYIVRRELTPSDSPEGVVLSQEPAEGTVVPRYSTVKLTVSAGKERVLVPDVLLQSRADAERVLANSGLHPVFTEEYSDLFDPDIVFLQEPESNLMTEQGSDIQLKVSLGPAPVETTDVPLKTRPQTRPSSGQNQTVQQTVAPLEQTTVPVPTAAPVVETPPPATQPPATEPPAPATQAPQSNDEFEGLVDFYSGS